ncbi:formylglycine-generating enzyme family protein [Pediococcus acidilactici]|uniref:formylglycine-generating enzyme family protein n=1 Tax=Pediococcus acidilactici TaxID=1254 RepID=UPI003CF6A14D
MDYQKISGETFKMGTNKGGFPEDFEGPQELVTVTNFEIAKTAVTNREFGQFVKETNYKTVAETKGNSFVFQAFIPQDKQSQYLHPTGAPWWLVVPGASWRHPFGPDSDIEDILDHPVVHVGLEDAIAFCEWAGAKLPTEAQWECAARSGSTTEYPWGDELVVDKKYHANTWQGKFPWENDALDGFVGTAPVKSFAPNANGLYQMIGNVWEWCRNPRYVPLLDFNQRVYELKSSDKLKGEFAIRGGSFLCHCSYCNRYRVAARNGADYQSTSSHLGFRCIKEDY